MPIITLKQDGLGVTESGSLKPHHTPASLFRVRGCEMEGATAESGAGICISQKKPAEPMAKHQILQAGRTSEERRHTARKSENRVWTMVKLSIPC